jgi:N-terminal half of MaoC dehydratase
MTIDLTLEGKIREFARATKSRNPAYDGQPGDNPVSPGTFLMAAAFWQGPAANPFNGIKRNFQRILHGEQEFTFHESPPRAGDVLVGTSRIDKVYEKPGKRGGSMMFTELVTEFRDPTGRLVAETRSTTIETSKPTGQS